MELSLGSERPINSAPAEPVQLLSCPDVEMQVVMTKPARTKAGNRGILNLLVELISVLPWRDYFVRMILVH